MTDSDTNEHTKEGLRRTLRDLSNLHGVSGFEQAVVRYIRQRLESLVDEVETDRFGNVTALKRGRNAGPLLMLSAHMDEIGFIVKSVEANGFLRFARIGGSGDGLLGCRKVDVNGHFGLIGSLSGHLGSAARLGQVAPVSELYIDVGASSADAVSKMGINVGDPVSFISEFMEFTGGDRVCAKAMDDHAGLAIMIQVLTELKGEIPFGSVRAVATVLEQVGLRGAAMAAYRIKPDYALAIDGSPAADTPDLSVTKDSSVSMGNGPVVNLAMSSGDVIIRGHIAHPAMKRQLLAAAATRRVPVQLAAKTGGGSSEAALIHIARGGIPAITVGVPRRYSFSPHEVIDLRDATGAVNLIVQFIREMENHIDLGFV
ncbi:putative aminopeptidase FrvX [Bradyrhizobium elkanii]